MVVSKPLIPLADKTLHTSGREDQVAWEDPFCLLEKEAQGPPNQLASVLQGVLVVGEKDALFPLGVPLLHFVFWQDKTCGGG